jgi:hypothetical protein
MQSLGGDFAIGGASHKLDIVVITATLIQSNESFIF